MYHQTMIVTEAQIVEQTIACLRESNPTIKCAMLRDIEISQGEWRSSGYCVAAGRPARPRLVHPRELPGRGLGSPAGHGAFVHAICHIEFTAINLALDGALRFAGMPPAYYADWLAVAREEAEHFTLLSDHLVSLGYRYGDFEAHDGLWDMAEKTAHDVLARMALVPRVMEARGLDVTPPMIKRLEAIDDHRGAEILRRIYRDEIGHVRIGTRWFKHVCEIRAIEPEAAFGHIVKTSLGGVRGERFNIDARLSAGFSEAELAALAEMR